MRLIVNLPAEVYDAIRAAAVNPFKDEGVRRTNGSYDVPIGEDIMKRILSVKLPGESVGDTILRALALGKAGGFN